MSQTPMLYNQLMEENPPFEVVINLEGRQATTTHCDSTLLRAQGLDCFTPGAGAGESAELEQKERQIGYVPPRWVDGGYGVQVLEPGYWTVPKLP